MSRRTFRTAPSAQDLGVTVPVRKTGGSPRARVPRPAPPPHCPPPAPAGEEGERQPSRPTRLGGRATCTPRTAFAAVARRREPDVRPVPGEGARTATEGAGGPRAGGTAGRCSCRGCRRGASGRSWPSEGRSPPRTPRTGGGPSGRCCSGTGAPCARRPVGAREGRGARRLQGPSPPRPAPHSPRPPRPSPAPPSLDSGAGGGPNLPRPPPRPGTRGP